MTTALFILKRREDYSSDSSYYNSYQIATGMWNSAKFVADALNAETRGIADVQLAIDGNDIDRVVTQDDPKVVIIEGLWVTPGKFAELLDLRRHQKRKWVVRIHSEIPFLATESIAMDWIAEYMKLGIIVAPNSPRAHDQFRAYAVAQNLNPRNVLMYLPNCFPTDFRALIPTELDTTQKTTLDIACFGAVRPLKNHLQQALVAIRFAESQGKSLRFHINDRQDAGGSAPYRNLQGMFEHLPSTFELVLHAWEDRTQFLTSMQNIDLLMQDSLSETFNIVAADAVWVGRPVLGSGEIPWLYQLYSNPTDQIKSLEVLNLLWNNKPFFINQNRASLKKYATKSANRWVRFIRLLTSASSLAAARRMSADSLAQDLV